ncbi:MAG: MTAP family purine nucleoside phosphorylase [Fimbriimonadaceae bacterium]
MLAIILAMLAEFGLILGTGVSHHLDSVPHREVHIPTRFGQAEGLVFELGGAKWLGIRRHARGHKLPPHSINYRAIAEAMRLAKVEACYATAAVGSLHPDWPVGTVAACSDFIDLTFRNVTVLEDSVVHTPFDEPYCAKARGWLLNTAASAGLEVHPEAVYAATNGPRYETPAEVRMLRILGADIVGMTGTTEAICMKELGVCYSCVGIVTNLGEGLSEHKIDHQEAEEIARDVGKSVFRLFGAIPAAATA